MSIVVADQEEDAVVGQISKWLTLYGSWILYGMAITAFILVLLFRFSMSDRSTSETDFIKADMFYYDFKYKMDESALEKLTSLRQAYPELGRKYDAKLAQLFLARGETAKGVTLGTSVLERDNGLVSKSFLEFSEASLLLDQGNLDGVLASVAVISDVDGEVLSNLESFNLLRAAVLRKSLGQEAQNTLWIEKISPQVLAHLEEGGVDLLEFLKS